MNEQQVKEQAAEALPMLLAWGLAERCDKCKRLREWAKCKPGTDTQLLLTCKAQALLPPHGSYQDVIVQTNMNVDCKECLNTGVVPTLMGYRLIAFVKLFSERASTKELDTIDPIPF